MVARGLRARDSRGRRLARNARAASGPALPPASVARHGIRLLVLLVDLLALVATVAVVVARLGHCRGTAQKRSRQCGYENDFHCISRRYLNGPPQNSRGPGTSNSSK
jgi:hypothetical protein